MEALQQLQHNSNALLWNTSFLLPATTTVQHTSTTIASTNFSSNSFWHEWYAKLERDLWETQVNSLKVWGTAQSFNFLVLPPHTRVLFSNCVLMVWTAYLSVVGHRDNADTVVEVIKQDWQ